MNKNSRLFPDGLVLLPEPFGNEEKAEPNHSSPSMDEARSNAFYREWNCLELSLGQMRLVGGPNTLVAPPDGNNVLVL